MVERKVTGAFYAEDGSIETSDVFIIAHKDERGESMSLTSHGVTIHVPYAAVESLMDGERSTYNSSVQ